MHLSCQDMRPPAKNKYIYILVSKHLIELSNVYGNLMVHAKRRDSYNIDMNYINALSVCIFNTYEYVTDVLHVRTVVRKRNTYICV